MNLEDLIKAIKAHLTPCTQRQEHRGCPACNGAGVVINRPPSALTLATWMTVIDRWSKHEQSKQH